MGRQKKILKFKIKCRAIIVIVKVVLLFSVDSIASNKYIGFIGGVNSSKLSKSEYSSIESINNYAIGVTSYFPITAWVSFQPELLYTVKGAKGKVIYGITRQRSIEGTAKLKYLELPLLFRFMFTYNRSLFPHIFVGPAIAANISAVGEGVWGSQHINGDIMQVIDTRDICFVVGGGVDFIYKTIRISLDARYTQGLVPVDYTRTLIDLKNQVWTFSTTIFFPVGKYHVD